jgi:hypothetical protein
MAFRKEPSYTHGTIPKTAVVLINLGTPDAPTAPAVRRYLKEFLSDPRVVEIPRLIWWLILNGIILPIRSSKSAAKYASIWTADGSPLKVHTQKQATMLRGYLGERGHEVRVEYAMRYGTPSVASVLEGLHADGCERILVLPAYPQYSGTTTASIFDAVFAHYKVQRNAPELRTIKHYHDHPAYIEALRLSVLSYWMQHGRPDKLVMSFQADAAAGRPLPLRMSQDGPSADHGPGPDARSMAADLPVALRQGRVAAAVHGADTEKDGRAGRQAGRRAVPGIHERLPGNAGRNLDGSPARLPGSRRQGVQLHSVPE